MKQLKDSRRPRGTRADERDAEIGHRVRLRRLELGLSQTDLATRIGVRFQQVQKYEKGVNRIGAGRLQRIAEALEVPITFFFDAPPSVEARGRSGPRGVFKLLRTSGSMRVATAFNRIKSSQTRRLIVYMMEELADANT